MWVRVCGLGFVGEGLWMRVCGSRFVVRADLLRSSMTVVSPMHKGAVGSLTRGLGLRVKVEGLLVRAKGVS